MAATVAFETGHEEIIHDAQLDYYGKRLATASSDRSVRLFNISVEPQQLVATLNGHDGPVWQVAWAHPKFGTLLASCSYDGKVVIWKEHSPGQWGKIFEDGSHQCSVNSLAWAPHTFGLILAVGAADGKVSVFTHQEDQTWEHKSYFAHKGGVNSISWGPELKTGALQDAQVVNAQQALVKELLTGGCDNCIRIWKYSEQTAAWKEEHTWANGDNRHRDWVRDAQWAPSLGLPSSTIASCSEDKSVIIWSNAGNGTWQKAKVLNFDQKVWRVSWSIMGNVLAVSQGDNKVSLWKEGVDGEWQNLSTMEDGAPQ